MFSQYEETHKQSVNPEVVRRVFNVTAGQPGLTSWFGELLTGRFNEKKDQPIGLRQYKKVLEQAFTLPNAAVTKIIHKADQAANYKLFQAMFRSNSLLPITLDDPKTHFLYINGVVKAHDTGNRYVIRFANPFLEQRLFNYFAEKQFKYPDRAS